MSDPTTPPDAGDNPDGSSSDGPLIAGYDRLTVVGHGGSSTVYSARRASDGAAVAVKVFDSASGSAFARQRDAARQLGEIAGVLAVYDDGTLGDGRHYVVTPFASGGSLGDHMTRFGAMPAERVARLGARLAHSLNAAHRAGVIHRDLKPSNLLLHGDDDPVIADFGAATTVDTATATETMAITIMYAAPEVLEGASADERSDVYSLALALIAVATGAHPFAGSEDSGLAKLLNTICSAGVPDPSTLGLPAGLAAVLGRATSLDPADRYTNAGELAGALDAVNTDPDSVPAGAGRRTPSARPPWMISAAAATVIALVGGLGFVLTRGDRSDAESATDTTTTTELVLEDFGAPVTERNGMMGPLYQQDDITYVGLMDPPCPEGGRLAQLATRAGPADFARGVETPWEAVKGEGVGVFMAWMPCDTKINEARFKLGATGRWFVYIAEFPEDQYQTMVGWMRENENSPSPDYTVDEDVLKTLENPDVYKGWAIIDRPE